jgi:hypothetical protein
LPDESSSAIKPGELALLDHIKSRIKRTVFAFPFIYAKSFFAQPKAQNDESTIISALLRRYLVPETFIEFGFSGWEFNCATLARTWRGLLVDGDLYNVWIARTIFRKNITSMQLWLTLETPASLESWIGTDPLGILSVDVDGNDYWFLQRLIVKRPALIIAEYNSSLGLHPVTVPYDPQFDRIRKHDSRTYYGCSLSALNHLARQHGYSLVQVSESGVNAFFVRDDLLQPDEMALDPASAFKEKVFKDGSRSAEQWERIKHLPFVDVTESPSLVRHD